MSNIKEDIRTARSATNRIRSSLKYLPSTIAAEAFNEDSDKETLIDILQEIQGCVAMIAEVAKVDL